MTITVFCCPSLEDFLVAEAKAQEAYEQAHPEGVFDIDCRHCGEPLGLDEDPYRQECPFCGRAIYGGP